jgi:hypothetical protein
MSRSNRIGLILIAFITLVTLLVMNHNAHAQEPPHIVCASATAYDCPAQCKKDLNYIYNDVKLERMNLSAFTALAGKTNYRTWGMWLGPPMISNNKQHVILIDPAATSWFLEEIKHHEACHEETYRVTGSPNFHK